MSIEMKAWLPQVKWMILAFRPFDKRTSMEILYQKISSSLLLNYGLRCKVDKELSKIIRIFCQTMSEWILINACYNSPFLSDKSFKINPTNWTIKAGFIRIAQFFIFHVNKIYWTVISKTTEWSAWSAFNASSLEVTASSESKTVLSIYVQELSSL